MQGNQWHNNYWGFSLFEYSNVKWNFDVTSLFHVTKAYCVGCNQYKDANPNKIEICLKTYLSIDISNPFVSIIMIRCRSMKCLALSVYGNVFYIIRLLEFYIILVTWSWYWHGSCSTLSCLFHFSDIDIRWFSLLPLCNRTV